MVATPPPTPLIPRRLLDTLNGTTNDFQKMTINTNLPLTPPKSGDVANTNWSFVSSSNEVRNNPLFSRGTDTTPKTATSANLLTPTSIDRYLAGHRRLSDSTFSSSTGKYLRYRTNSIDFYLSLDSARSSTAHSISWYNNNNNNETVSF